LLGRPEVSLDPVSRIGVGCPGPIDVCRGVVANPPNLPGWSEVRLLEHIQGALGLPTALENDANAAALGEYVYGAGRDAQSLFYMTVSTGIGGGIVLNGQIWHGVNGVAGEVGHMTVLPDGPICGCGNHGCLETLASGPAIVRRAQAAAVRRPSAIRDVVDLKTSDVERLARAGDEVALEVWNTAIKYLGIGVAGVIALLGPECVILGGGVTTAGDFLFEPLRAEVRRHLHIVPPGLVPILPAALGTDVGIRGAAAVAMKSGMRTLAQKTTRTTPANVA
jgi:glucokinase